MFTRWIIGLSSGSSMSGVDAALVRVDHTGLDVKLTCAPGQYLHQPYARELRDLLYEATATETPRWPHLGMLHRILGETFTAAVFRLLDQTRLPRENVLAVSVPGQTVWHDPKSRFPNTLCLGMASAVAEGTGLTTLSDFRSRDVVLGGQGFPLTPLVDAMLFHDPKEHRVLIHLGGTVTVTSLPPGKAWWEVSAFQAAPCSLLLDRIMRRMTKGREPFDAGGKHAVQGRCIDALLEKWLAHPALLKHPPRLISLDDFGEAFLDQALESARHSEAPIHDLLCTATHFVARATLAAVRGVGLKPDRILLSGGCVRNGFLWRLLEQQLAPIPVERSDNFGVPSEARKAIAFAGLAALTFDGVPVNLPTATGASSSRLLGSFTPGMKENWARCLAWMSARVPATKLRAA